MAELNVEIPKQLEPTARALSREELKEIVSKALREKLSERLMFKVADELLKNSEVTDELALKWGRDLKSRAAKKCE